MTTNPLVLRFEWVDVTPSPDRLSQATMARLEILLRGEPLIRVLDHRTKSYREAVRVPLHSLAEWFVSNWWFLWREYESLPPGKPAEFDSRHDLRHAADGFAFPSIILTPLGSQLRVQARPNRLTHTPIEFLGASEGIVDRDQVESALWEFIDTVVMRLRDEGCPETPLEQQWRVLNELDNDELEFCQASALLGLDPFDISDNMSDSIIAVWNKTGCSYREDLFAGAGPDSLTVASGWVEDWKEKIANEQSGAAWSQLRALGVNPAGTYARPWDQGYALARSVRKAMGAPSGRFEFAGSGDWAIQSIVEDIPAPGIDGLVAANSPSCVLPPKNEAGGRFLLARAAGDFLVRPNGSPSLLTSLSNTRQRLTRAFAAELLAPSEELRERLGPEPVTISESAIDDLAEEYGVSGFVVRHQIKNHNLATVIDSE